MAINIPRLTTDVRNIQSLSDTPNQTEGLSSQGLKERFDKAGVDIKDYLNDRLVETLQTTLTTHDNTINNLQSDVGKLKNSNIETDVNGWKYVDHGTYTEYFRYGRFMVTFGGSEWGTFDRSHEIKLPVGLSYNPDNMSFSMCIGCDDGAIKIDCALPSDNTFVMFSFTNKYTGVINAYVTYNAVLKVYK